MPIKKHIPNAITCGNLLCGCIGIMITFQGHLDIAFLMIITAAVLDFFDGFAARLLNVSSPIGKDLDSLADMVTFGALPGFVMYKMVSLSIAGTDHWTGFPFIAFLIPVFSAIRLAKFNNDTRQTDRFIGVPTPANALFIGSLGYILFSHSFSSGGWVVTLPENTQLSQNFQQVVTADSSLQFLNNPYALGIITVIMSYLMVAELPLFALKFKNFRWPDNKIRYIFLGVVALLLILFQITALPFIILLYIVLSIIENSIAKQNQQTHNT
jgi:CDP-diacylglycerol--serine O-phosphatidyltransferase